NRSGGNRTGTLATMRDPSRRQRAALAGRRRAARRATRAAREPSIRRRTRREQCGHHSWEGGWGADVCGKGGGIAADGGSSAVGCDRACRTAEGRCAPCEFNIIYLIGLCGKPRITAAT